MRKWGGDDISVKKHMDVSKNSFLQKKFNMQNTVITKF